MTKHEEMQAFVRYYKRQNKKTVVTMAEIAKAAIAQGWPVPPPVSGEERLAKQFADAEREEIRYDKKTKRPYRANLAMTQRLKDGKQLALWIDTDEANRSRSRSTSRMRLNGGETLQWKRKAESQPSLSSIALGLRHAQYLPVLLG